MKFSGRSLFKGLTSKIHPPLPLTPRDSQKLLGLLNESFRHQLHAEPTEQTVGNLSPINAHVKSVLSSPLFQSPSKSPKVQSRDKRIPGKNVADIQDLLVAPMQYFQEQVVAGQATLDLARRCLKVQRHNKLTYKYPVSPNTEGDSETGAHPVLHWLWASGLEESMEFVHNPDFLHELVLQMIIENRDDQLWKWVWRLEKGWTDHTPDSEPSPFATPSVNSSELLTRFIRAVSVVRHSIDDAISVFIKASAELEHSFPSRAAKVLKRPAADLSYLILRANATSICESPYDDLLSILRRLQLDSLAIKARLSLYHPSKPDVSKALMMIRKEYIPEQPTSRCSFHFQQMCLRTKELLVAAGREREATEVMDVYRRLSDKNTSATWHTEGKHEEDLKYQVENIRPMLV